MKKNAKNEIIILGLVLTLAATFCTLPTVIAHDPPLEIPTYSYLAAEPNPIGVGQTAYLVFWIDKVPPTAAGVGGERWRNLTVDVIKPNGDTETLGPFTSDPVGGGYSMYTPDQVGTYTFKFNFPGQIASLTGPTGIPGDPSPYIGDNFLASSKETTLIVQQDPIANPPVYPLPTEYWSRPIEAQNPEWYRVASNWLRGAHIVGRYQPDGKAPNSAHIMWTKPISFGGVVGGSNTGVDGSTFYSGLSYEAKFTNPIIMCGRLYYSLPLSDAGTGGGYVCVDLLTGETIWERDDLAPSFGQLYNYESFNQHGVIPNGYLWSAPGRFDPPGTPYQAYDPFTGEPLFGLTNVPSGTEVYGPNGEILRYVLNTQGNWLALWNNTAEQQGLHGALGTGSSAYQWRPIGKTVNMSAAYTWNVTIPTLPAGASIRYVIHDDLILGSSGTFPGIGRTSVSSDPYTMWAISLRPSTRGQLLWSKEYPAPAGGLTVLFGHVEPESRVFTIYFEETMQWTAYSIDNGNLLWGPTDPEPDWSFYSGIALVEFTAVADGRLYTGGYSGELRCYDLTTGNILWIYDNTYSGFATGYGNYPLSLGAIADGKIYVYSSEHSPNAPPFKGYRVRCIDITNGEEKWTIFGYSSGGIASAMAISDGYLVHLNLYDMQVYCFGKGPSATTVTVQDDVVPWGDSILIKGMVTDISPGTEQHIQSKRFPNGVPAIADEYMTEWMEYVYMQKPCPDFFEGVEVKLETLDPNNNFYEIGTVTSDASGMYKILWEPPVPGEYTIIATFAGSDSYYASYAETAVGVTEKQSPSGSIEPELNSLEAIESTSAGSLMPHAEEQSLISVDLTIITTLVVSCIIGIIAFWELQKRK